MAISESQRRWAKNNPEKVKAIKRRFVEKHRERLAAKRREYRAKNRAALDTQKRAWEVANPEMVSMQAVRRRIKAMNAKIDQGLRYHYGVTLDAYNAILCEQRGVCAICGTLSVTVRSPRLVVDHDHSTGELRGLLCHRCNCGLGYFKDNHGIIERALAYLRGFDESGEKDWAARVRSVLVGLPAPSGESRCDESLAEVIPIAGVARQDSEGVDVAEDTRAMAS